jgi:hypothetical protein
MSRSRLCPFLTMVAVIALSFVTGCRSPARAAKYADEIAKNLGRSADDVTRRAEWVASRSGGNTDDVLKTFLRLSEPTDSSPTPLRTRFYEVASDLSIKYDEAADSPTGEFLIDVTCGVFDDLMESESFDLATAFRNALKRELESTQRGFDSAFIKDVIERIEKVLATNGDVGGLAKIAIDDLLLGCPLERK